VLILLGLARRPDDTDETILAALARSLFASLLQLARLTHLLLTTVYTRLIIVLKEWIQRFKQVIEHKGTVFTSKHKIDENTFTLSGKKPGRRPCG
jgi:hypothetical protein